MLHSPRMVPGNVVCHDPREHDDTDSNETQVHSGRVLIVGAYHNVIHIARETRHHDQSHVHDQESKETEHCQEMDRTGGLPSPEYPRIPRKPVDHRRRHRDAGRYREHSEYKHHREIGDLLQCIVAIEPVWFWGQMKCRVVHEGIPCLHNNQRRNRHNSFPLFRGEEHDDKNDARGDETVYINEMPYAGKTNRMAVAWRADERRDVARIVFRGPDTVPWNAHGRKTNPFAPRCATVVEIKTRMVHQDRQPAADQDHHKKKIEEVTVAYPHGKTMRSYEVIGVYLGNSRNRRHPR